MCDSQVSGCQLLACQVVNAHLTPAQVSAGLDGSIFADVIAVIVIDEAEMRRRQINQQRDERKQQTDDART